MELHIFARFHARPDQEAALEATLRAMAIRVRAETGCLAIAAFRSVSEKALFHVKSSWTDEAAFHHHAALPETGHFVEHILSMMDHPLDVTPVRAL